MFDLFRSRAKAVRYLLGALLMLVAISMVVTLIPGYGTTGGQNDQIVAEIGDDVITAREVNWEIQRALRGGVPREMAALYVPQIIDDMITKNAIIYKAQQMGFKVTEDDLAQTIRMVFPQLFQGGQFAGKEAYAAVLANENLTIPEFEANLRKQILLQRLQNLVAEGIVVSDAEIERAFKRQNEKIKLDYVKIGVDTLRSEASVTPQEVEQYFQANRSQFQLPEKRSVAAVVVDEAKIAARVSANEDELRRAYEANKEQYRLPERVQVRHILLKTTDKPAAEVPKIQARTEELLKQLKGGADFAELAKKNSEDPGSAVKGGDLGWVVRGQTVSAFESAAFSLQPKQLSNVIKTEYGFHILQVMAKEPARVQPFEEVKEQIAKDQNRQRVFDTMQQLADQARAELEKNPTQAEQIASKLGLQFVRAENVSAGTPLPEIGASREFDDAYAGLARGGVTPVVQVAPTKLAIGVVTDLTPARPAELADVQNQIRDTLITRKAEALLDQRAKQLAEKARASGDLKGLGLDVKSTQEFSRTGAADGIGAASALEEAFERPVGSLVGPVALGNDRFIVKVTSRTEADMSQLQAQRASLRDSIKGSKARDRYELFTDSVRNALTKDGDVKIHKDVVNRITASFRG